MIPSVEGQVRLHTLTYIAVGGWGWVPSPFTRVAPSYHRMR